MVQFGIQHRSNRPLSIFFLLGSGARWWCCDISAYWLGKSSNYYWTLHIVHLSIRSDFSLIQPLIISLTRHGHISRGGTPRELMQYFLSPFMIIIYIIMIHSRELNMQTLQTRTPRQHQRRHLCINKHFMTNGQTTLILYF